MIEASISIYAWYGIYVLAILAHVFGRGDKRAAMNAAFFVFLVGIGYFLSFISIEGVLVSLLGFALAATEVDKTRIWYGVRVVALLVLSLAMALHLFEGFHNQRVFESASFGSSGLPFGLWMNLDKSLAALILLQAFGAKAQWRISRGALGWMSASILGFFMLALGLGAKVEFKLSELTLFFAVLNLFTTCIAEEAFFRLVLQDHIAMLTRKRNTTWLPITITAVLFMLAHFHLSEGFIERLTLIFSAGLIYGIAYRRFNFGLAVLVHFSINIVHFIFFTYPATFA